MDENGDMEIFHMLCCGWMPTQMAKLGGIMKLDESI
jgi:hypothetical protein